MGAPSTKGTRTVAAIKRQRLGNADDHQNIILRYQDGSSLQRKANSFRSSQKCCIPAPSRQNVTSFAEIDAPYLRHNRHPCLGSERVHGHGLRGKHRELWVQYLWPTMRLFCPVIGRCHQNRGQLPASSLRVPSFMSSMLLPHLGVIMCYPDKM